jgi:transposase
MKIYKNKYNILRFLAINSNKIMFKQTNQFNLIPQDYKSFLWEWHEVIILEEIINELDLTEIIESYSNFSRWTTAYHPRMLLKVLFYWYMNQTFSSRKLEKKLKTDLAFIYLAWNNQPNFRTINKFRKDKWWMLEWIFVQIVLKAKELWLISFWTVSLDWTKIYANASKNKNNDLKWLDKKISKLFDEADKIDKLEDKEYWDNEDEIPEELKTKEGRDKKKKEIAKKKKRLEDKKEEVKKEIQVKKDDWINQTRINDTDKDSRLMQMKKKDWWNWYNPQNTTEKQFIISVTVPNTANDSNELVSAMKKIKKQYWISPDKLLADKW